MEQDLFQSDQYHPAKVNVSSQPLDHSASKQKFSFKIKIAPNSSTKPSGDDEEGSPPAGPDLHAPGYRVCEYCGKEFSSGKAWGGHKRHHLKNDKDLKKARKLELNKIHGKKIKKQEPKSATRRNSSKCNTIKAGDVSMSNEGKPTCVLCGKVFPSVYSLFGHMRFHPDRGWKGTQPPASSADKHSSSSGLSEAAAGLEVDQIGLATEKGSDDSVDLLTSLSSWTKRDKRGRTLDPVEADYCNLDPVMAACNLIELSCDKGRLEKQKIDELLRSKKLKLKINEESATKSSQRNPVDVIKEEVDQLRIVTDDDLKAETFDNGERGDSYWYNEAKGKKKEESEEMDGEAHSMITKKRKKTLMMNWMGKLNDSETPGSYKNIGSRGYDRGGELVDYKSNLGVKGHVLPATEVERAEETEEDGSLIPMGIYSFQCDICHKIFPTGQALGGHKRCHWKGPVKAPSNEVGSLGEASQNTSTTESSAEANQAGEATRSGANCRLNFDLNIPYIMEDGE